MSNGEILSQKCHLLALPAELHLKVLHELVQQNCRKQALRPLSQTCKFFFNEFKDELYHTLTLRADSKSGRSLQRISAGPRASLVKKVIFRANDPRPAWERHQDSRYRLSIPSKQVLIFLNRFANLQEFELDVEWKLDLWFSEHPEPSLYPIKGHSETYRFILDETLRALGRSAHHNQARALPKLSIRRLPPRVYQALIDHGMHTLLNDLRIFRIEFMEETRQPVSLAHSKFISRAKDYYLSHLNNVRVLHLQASPDSVIGEGNGLPAIDFSKVKMPFLRKVKFEHFILGKGADDFILRHLGTLYSVMLENCYKDQSWSSLFVKIVRRKPSRLTRFEVSGSSSTASGAVQLESDSETIRQDEEISLHENKRTFPRVQNYCGHIWKSTEDEMAELESGSSMAAWLRLQNVVEANRLCWERFAHSRSTQALGRTIRL